jgi:HEXXH motif-containing protein
VAALSRALAQIPARPDRVVDVHVADWTDSERTVFRAAARLLAQVWPQMLTELSVCIRQVALLRGYGITGFSDFTVHGAIFVNEERLTFGDRDSLPGPVRLAESLIHEGAHNRCFSAAVRDPFLPADNSDARVSTPLRADPRPLWGLFQQLVVLCRSTHLYQRLGPAAPIQGRYEVLITQARQALGTLRAHADQLTDHGRAVLAEASTAVTASSCPT